jgi:hypothetical protein
MPIHAYSLDTDGTSTAFQMFDTPWPLNRARGFFMNYSQVGGIIGGEKTGPHEPGFHRNLL